MRKLGTRIRKLGIGNLDILIFWQANTQCCVGELEQVFFVFGKKTRSSRAHESGWSVSGLADTPRGRAGQGVAQRYVGAPERAFRSFGKQIRSLARVLLFYHASSRTALRGIWQANSQHFSEFMFLSPGKERSGALMRLRASSYHLAGR